ncbi:ABC transporter permease [Spirillospora sp. NBC_00431]
MRKAERDYSALAVVRLIAGRELRVRIRSAWFVAGTVITVVVIAVLVFMPRFMPGDDDHEIAVVGLSAQQEAVLKTDSARLRRAGDAGQARAWLEGDEVDALVAGTPSSPPQVTIADRSNLALAGQLRDRLERHAYAARLQHLGVTPPSVRIEPMGNVRGDRSDPGQRMVFAYIVSLMLFSQIVGAGGMVAQGVVEEKHTRVIEILLAKVRPTVLLVGKVIGIGMVGLIQLLAVAVAGVSIALAAGTLDIGSTIVQVAATSLVWYVLGFVFYAFVYAAVGAMASHPEDLPGMTVPLQVFNTAALLVAVVGLQDMGARWLALISYVPPFSAVLVPMRMAGGHAGTTDVVVPAIILAIATVCVAMAGGRLYRRSITHLGARKRLPKMRRRAGAPAKADV